MYTCRLLSVNQQGHYTAATGRKQVLTLTKTVSQFDVRRCFTKWNVSKRKDLGVTNQAGSKHVQQVGDENDFDTLFLSHYNVIYRLVFRIVDSRQEAEDLAQETFFRLHRERFSQDRQHNLRAWLFRVATNLAYNLVRDRQRQARYQEAASRDQARAMQERSPDPLDVSLQSDERETVRRVLAGLSARQSKLLLLRYAGLSYRELAEVLEVSPGSIGTLLARATAAFEAHYRATVMDSEKGDDDGM